MTKAKKTQKKELKKINKIISFEERDCLLSIDTDYAPAALCIDKEDGGVLLTSYDGITGAIDGKDMDNLYIYHHKNKKELHVGYANVMHNVGQIPQKQFKLAQEWVKKANSFIRRNREHCIVEDNDGHCFVIPKHKLNTFNVDIENELGIIPYYAMPIGGDPSSLLTFKDFTLED